MRRSILITTILILPQLALARGYSELRADWRELCRQEVAGTYLVYLDRYRIAQDQLTRGLTQQEKTDVHLKVAVKDLASIEQHLKQNPYNAQLAEKLDDASTRINVLESQLTQFKDLVQQASTGLALAKRSHYSFSDRLGALFEVREDASLADRGYPIEIRYKSDCPRFRSVCPLTHRDKARLEAIFAPEDPPESCRNYLNIN